MTGRPSGLGEKGLWRQMGNPFPGIIGLTSVVDGILAVIARMLSIIIGHPIGVIPHIIELALSDCGYQLFPCVRQRGPTVALIKVLLADCRRTWHIRGSDPWSGQRVRRPPDAQL